MTDKAKELNELAANLASVSGLCWVNGLGDGGTLAEEERDAIVRALRLAATMEEFGEIGADKAPTLRKMPSGWLASISAPAAHGNIEETPIEAMRAAIDAAKPKHEHELHWMWAGTADRPTFHVATCNWCDHAESSDRLVALRAYEAPCQHTYRGIANCSVCGAFFSGRLVPVEEGES